MPRAVARVAFALVLSAACLLPALWPGDTPWTSDEPNLLASALRANRARRLASIGLHGSFGVAYGPLPTQVYQALLLFTRDPVTLVAVRAVLFTAATAAGLLWLGRTLKLKPAWFVPAVLLSPYLWLYARILWDNTFAIPVGVLSIAAYASFLTRGTRGPLLTTLGCAIALVSIHLMTLPLVAALGGHLLWRHRGALRRHRAGVAVVLVVAAVSNAGYVWTGVERGWRLLAHRCERPARVDPANAPHSQPAQAVVQPRPPTQHPRPPRVSAFLFPLQGGRLLSGDGFYAVPPAGSDPADAALVRAASAVSWLAFPLVWAGVVVAACRLVRAWRAGLPHSPRDTIGGICLAALALQMGMDGVMRVAPYTHYFTGTAAVYLLFAWLAVDAARPPVVRGAVAGLWGASLALVTVHSAADAHFGERLRQDAGPTLADQIDVARSLNRYADTIATTDVPRFRDYPQSLWGLRLLLSQGEQPAAKSPHGLAIRYREVGGRRKGIEVVELPHADAGPQYGWSIPLSGPLGPAPGETGWK